MSLTYLVSQILVVTCCLCKIFLELILKIEYDYWKKGKRIERILNKKCIINKFTSDNFFNKQLCLYNNIQKIWYK